MPKVTYIQADDSRTTLDVPSGTSVMKAAIANDVDGIIADCGGSLSCATCHVYLQRSSPQGFPERSEEEDEMLEDVVCERTDESRLSCQLVLTDETDDVVVALPEEQW
jgi:ferredoxin, 2Fe-2S